MSGRGARAAALALCVAAFGLAGCDSLPDLGQLAPSADTMAPASAPEPAPSPPVAVTAVPPELGRLQNLSAAEVEALVGEPDFRRVEPPGELWQYRTADCVMDLFLYDKDGGKRVIHADARSRYTAESGDRCGAEVMRRRLRASLNQ